MQLLECYLTAFNFKQKIYHSFIANVLSELRYMKKGKKMSEWQLASKDEEKRRKNRN
jgi:hypothetical protein